MAGMRNRHFGIVGKCSNDHDGFWQLAVVKRSFFFIFAVATNRVIASVHAGEESPDSKGQCTGEEPGGAQAFTESATEKTCLAAALANVR